MLAVAESNGRVDMMEPRTRRIPRYFEGRGQVDALAFSPDGSALAIGRSPFPGSASSRASVEVMGTRTYAPRPFSDWGEAGPAALACPPDGPRLGTVQGESLVVYDGARRDPIDKPIPLGGTASGLVVLPGGDRVLVAVTPEGGRPERVVVDLATR